MQTEKNVQYSRVEGEKLVFDVILLVCKRINKRYNKSIKKTIAERKVAFFSLNFDCLCGGGSAVKGETKQMNPLLGRDFTIPCFRSTRRFQQQ